MAHTVVKHLDVYHTWTVCFHQHIFLAKHNRFRIGTFCVTKYSLFGVMYRVAPLSQYQLSASTQFPLEAPLHAQGTHQHSFLQLIYPLCSLYAAPFEGCYLQILPGVIRFLFHGNTRPAPTIALCSCCCTTPYSSPAIHAVLPTIIFISQISLSTPFPNKGTR